MARGVPARSLGTSVDPALTPDRGVAIVEQLLWSVMIRADNGPRIARSGSLKVEAYDKVAVSVAAGQSQEVELGAATAGSIRCLVISPAVTDELLTYEVGGTAIPLDEPQFLLGGAIALAGNPTKLTFTNGTAADTDIQILVGRDATP
jgi:hypothetical protein